MQRNSVTMSKRHKETIGTECTISPETLTCFYTMLNKFYNHANQEISISNLILHRNHYFSDPLQQSNLFADFYSDSDNLHEPIPLDLFGEKIPSLNKSITLQGVERAIRQSRNSTPGADGIPANWFKKLNYADISKITSIFQDIFSTFCIPSQRKHSLIVLIPKPSKVKTKLNSYRPIALTSVFSKIIEKIIGNRIIQHLTINKKISPS
ncbi:hypothetical protein AVEN_29056-1 [Araneus ventricosus]|uniref:Reverse transcriptase domain-containing protein n=1 Tax=Araneus ventricosus TaxID=182803 RepID=A0A4Y2AJJ8_ARAVE|nr:hypothetical protein AVEN_29056-1 [Araneus ventricosus]